MARFRGTVEGGREGKVVSRLGSVRSGLVVNANGWDIGARVELSVDKDGNDLVRVYRTGGSNGTQARGEVLISEYTADEESNLL